MTYVDYLQIFEKDENGRYLRLVIPKTDSSDEISLVGKTDSDFTLDEIIKMKKYSSYLFSLVDKTTIQ